MTKLIPLTQGKFAIVDAEDYDHLMQWKWCYDGGYAVRVNCLTLSYKQYVKTKIWMHRLIFNTPDGIKTDHINGDRLDNRKVNLRLASNSENQQNKKPKSNCSSKYKGVHWRKARRHWCANIKVNDKHIHLGSFKKEEDAALAYNFAAMEYFGEFARLNKAV